MLDPGGEYAHSARGSGFDGSMDSAMTSKSVPRKAAASSSPYGTQDVHRMELVDSDRTYLPPFSTTVKSKKIVGGHVSRRPSRREHLIASKTYTDDRML